MNKPLILTAIGLVLAISSWRVVSAYQESPPAEAAASDEPAPSAPAIVEVPPDPDATQAFQQARQQLMQHKTVQADMLQLVSLGLYRLKVEGKYASGQGLRYRLECRVNFGEFEGSFLEVCDGQVLHTRRVAGSGEAGFLGNVAGDAELTRRDIQRILKERWQNAQDPQAVLAADIGLGGLPSVLASLERTMNFVDVRDQTIQGEDYRVITARWKQQQRESLIGGLGSAASQIAGFMPDAVRIYLDADTLFPKRFVYLKQASQNPNSLKGIVSVEFRNVQLDEPVDAQLFTYSAPAGKQEKDETERFLEMIRTASQYATPPTPPATDTEDPEEQPDAPE